jgi:hypothetical protein
LEDASADPRHLRPRRGGFYLGDAGIGKVVGVGLGLGIVLAAGCRQPRTPLVSVASADRRDYLLGVVRSVADEVAVAARINHALARREHPEQTVVRLVAPIEVGFLARWTSDLDRARAEAQRKLRSIAATLAAAGIAIDARIGDEDVVQAVEDEINGVMAAVGVLRAWAGQPGGPPQRIGLVDWADEEGARFGRSLFGSSAAAGTFDPKELESAVDKEGNSARDVLAQNGVELDRSVQATAGLATVGGYLELHIEQGPVLDEDGFSSAAVEGCVGVERFWLSFGGRASHAGTTPLERRNDAGLAAAETMIGLERIAAEAGGVATTGVLGLDPGVATVIPGRATLSVDLRHRRAADLGSMARRAEALATAAATKRGVEVTREPTWRIEPIEFGPDLVAAAARLCDGRVMVSGGAPRRRRDRPCGGADGDDVLSLDRRSKPLPGRGHGGGRPDDGDREFLATEPRSAEHSRLRRGQRCQRGIGHDESNQHLRLGDDRTAVRRATRRAARQARRHGRGDPGPLLGRRRTPARRWCQADQVGGLFRAPRRHLTRSSQHRLGGPADHRAISLGGRAAAGVTPRRCRFPRSAGGEVIRLHHRIAGAVAQSRIERSIWTG